MLELILTPEQRDMLKEIVERNLIDTREHCWLFDVGSRDWNDLVARAQALRGLLSEIETI